MYVCIRVGHKPNPCTTAFNELFTSDTISLCSSFVQVWSFLASLFFYREELLAPPYLEAVSIRKLRTRRAVVTGDPPNMARRHIPEMIARLYSWRCQNFKLNMCCWLSVAVAPTPSFSEPAVISVRAAARQPKPGLGDKGGRDRYP
jgi:hypothetical protein